MDSELNQTEYQNKSKNFGEGDLNVGDDEEVAGIQVKTSENETSTIVFSYDQTHEVAEGSNVLLQCNFTTLGGFLHASWSRGSENLTKNMKLISDDERLNVIVDYDLKIDRVQHDDAGIYLCWLDLISSDYFLRLEVFDSAEDVENKEQIVGYTEIGIVNETIVLPCSFIYLESEMQNVQWTFNERIIAETMFENERLELRSRKRILGGFTLEIQNVQNSDSDFNYVCNIQDPVTKNSLGNITHKILISNKTRSMCSPSPCGLDSECLPLADDYPECVCRPDTNGLPPNCMRDRKNPFSICISENCKKKCESTCGLNGRCIVKSFYYKCICPYNYFGNPFSNCIRYNYSDLPNNQTTNKVYKINLNETVILPCSAPINVTSRMDPNWKKRPVNGFFQNTIHFPQKRLQTYYQYNLFFTYFYFVKTGYYACRLENRLENIELIYNLQLPKGSRLGLGVPIYRGPDIDPKIEELKSAVSITAEEGSEVILPCEGLHLGVTSHENLVWKVFDHFALSWQQSQILKEASINEQHSDVKILKGFNLEIQNVQPEDAGTYSCFLPFDPNKKQHFLVASYELIILDSSTVDESDPCRGNPCGENSECYPKKNKERECSCRPFSKGSPPHCKYECGYNKCDRIVCVNEYCKNICIKTCESQNNATCKIKNERWTCLCDDDFIQDPQKGCVLSDVPSDVSSDVPLVTGTNYSEPCDTVCMLFSIGGSIICLLMIIGLIIFCKRKSRRNKRKDLKQTENEDAAISLLEHYVKNKPDIYYEKWEFSRQRLVIKNIIGEGHYGRVFKAVASGLQGNEGTTTVAVKTLKENATGSHLIDLISEYELLKELNHPNIIRLLGVCTKNGPLYVIIEFAENGCLGSYLRKIKKEMAPQEMEKIYTPVFTTISPKNIVNFAWQIAKGMSYLAEMKILHRDLATRNVLLTRDLICKISDFGLARDVYRDAEYFKTSKAEVPIKWMAIESLYNDTYTTKSDVWSFGVLLWELITFGEGPYPGVPARNIYSFLKEGNRMKKPEGCSEEFYEIMQTCWREDSSARPAFSDLVKIFDDMLSSGIYYLQCSDREKDNNYVVAFTK